MGKSAQEQESTGCQGSSQILVQEARYARQAVRMQELNLDKSRLAPLALVTSTCISCAILISVLYTLPLSSRKWWSDSPFLQSYYLLLA